MSFTQKREPVLSKNGSISQYAGSRHFNHGKQESNFRLRPLVDPDCLHPCIRVFGCCKFGHGCVFAKELRHDCLRCLKNEPHKICDTMINRAPPSLRDIPVKQWSEDNVVQWLQGLESFSNLSANFKKQLINGEMLLRLPAFDEKTLSLLGLSAITRLRLFQELEKVQRPSGKGSAASSPGAARTNSGMANGSSTTAFFHTTEDMFRWVNQQKHDFEKRPVDAMHLLLSANGGNARWREVAACELPSAALFSTMVDLISGPVIAPGNEPVTWANDCNKLLSAFLGTSFFNANVVTHYINGGVTTATSASGSSVQRKIIRIDKILTVFDALLRRFAVASQQLPVDSVEKLVESIGEDCPESTQFQLTAVKGRRDDGLRQLEQQQPLPMNEHSRSASVAEKAVVTTYRQTKVFPSSDEIRADAPFLKKNVVNCALSSFEQHLDTQFHLLREDCLGSLRLGIQNHLGGMSSRENRDFKIYRDVRIVGISSNAQGIVYRVQFNGMQHIQWHRSKRLQVGSLVCLSYKEDDFHGDLMWATIARRSLEELKNQMICLRFPDVVEQKFRLGETYLMAETPVYFEAYQHVLHGLQRIDLTDFPFQKYFVGKFARMEPPEYLTPLVVYDFSALAKPEDPCPERLRWKALGEWPRPNPLQLDDTQLEALRLCLTKEVAIVQGPPGTGKTYLGIQTVRVMLKNRPKVNNVQPPILVVCYTNHALDQFLEGILKYEDNVVRIGGQCSEQLDPYNLWKLTSKTELPMSNVERFRYWKICQRRDEIQKSIAEVCTRMEVQTVETVDQLDIAELRAAHQYFDGKRKECEQQLIQCREDGCKLKLELEAANRRIAELDKLWNEAKPGVKAHVVKSWEKEWEKLTSNVPVLTQQLKENESECHRFTWRKYNPIMAWLQDTAPQFASFEIEEPMSDIIENAEPEAVDPVNDEADDDDFDMDDDVERAAQDRTFGDAGGQMHFSKINSKGWAAPPQHESRILNVENLDLLTTDQRHRLRKHWLQVIRQNLMNQLRELCKDFEETTLERRRIDENRNLTVLQKAAVVGVTTTGAAKYLDLLRVLKCEIVIVEEAAEVLEAHVLTALSNSTKHLLLIGDHQQLRPKVVMYELEKDKNLGVSLFERLVNLQLPYVTLGVQRRMRPEIFELTARLYPPIECHPNVLTYAKIKGMITNLHFFDHTHPEMKDEERQSPKNPFEAKWVVNVAAYLLRQGYNASQITIIVPYTGQLLLTRDEIRKTRLSVRVVSVDNFQGEENDIIILSLVRSNNENRAGFLKVAHRACVALSRAKMGLYVVGNFTVVEQCSEFWKEVCDHMRDQGWLSDTFTVGCQNHGLVTQLRELADFSDISEGGCRQPCDHRLDCGHMCTRRCHPDDLTHAEFKCREKCARTGAECHPARTCSHHCPKMCCNECGDCQVQLERTLECGHTQKHRCFETNTIIPCEKKCERLLLCGHLCTAKCGEPCIRKCSVMVEKTIPKCGHIIKMHCCEDPLNFKCPKACSALLPCDHKCPGTCDGCQPDVLGRCIHPPCKQPCKRVLVCGHVCESPCTKICPPCTGKCEDVCSHHSRCKKSCGEPCPPCKLPCQWKCPHFACDLRCHEPCTRPPCNERCPILKKCGHPCPGLCGEPCPSFCPKCEPESVPKVFLGREKRNARFIELPCGHAFEYRDLDKHMGVSWTTEKPLAEEPQPKPEAKAGTRSQNHKTEAKRVAKPSKWVTKPSEEATQKEVQADTEDCPNDVCSDPSASQNEGSEYDAPSETAQSENESQNRDHKPVRLQLKRCPLCSTPIRVCNRYNHLIKRTLADIAKVKEIIIAQRKQLLDTVGSVQKDVKAQLEATVNDYVRLGMTMIYPREPKFRRYRDWNDLATRLETRSKAPETITTEWFDALREQVHHLANLHKFRDHLRAMVPTATSAKSEVAGAALNKLENLMDQALDSTATVEAIQQLMREVRVLRLITDIQFAQLEAKVRNTSPENIERTTDLYNEITQLISSNEALTDDELQAFEDKVSEVCKLVNATPTPQELKEIHKALELTPGHWFKCPSGHLFIITECGGAMERGQCNECQAAIGGRDHHLESGTHTGEIDGSAGAAWDESIRSRDAFLAQHPADINL